MKFSYVILIVLLFGVESINAQLSQKDLDTCTVFNDLDEALLIKDEVYKLDLTRYKLKSIPISLLELPNLQWLRLDKNKLTSIDFPLDSLKKLTFLSISKNDLTSFPQSITHLVNLETLILNQNVITGVPWDIRNLKKLEYLDLWGNEISNIPSSIAECVSLKTLDLQVIQFSDSEKEKIASYIPNVTIKFSNSCNCGY